MRIRSEIKSAYINDTDYEMAKIANALAHPVRVALVRYLTEKNGGRGVDNVTCNKDLVGLFDYSLAADLYIDCNEGNCSAVLTQGQKGNGWVVAMVGRPLLVTEVHVPLLERRLLTAAWAMKGLQQYTWWTPVTIRFPEVAEATLVQA